jgi:3-oxoacyl-[acyl-carrier protein] reductase
MNRSVLITGGNRGLGLAVARAFAKDGDRVAVTYRTSAPEEDFLAVRCDVTDPDTIESAFAAVEAENGPVEVLIANAGIAGDKLAVHTSDEDFTAVLDTNLTGAFRAARRALGNMLRARWGRLLFMSSAAATMGGLGSGQVSYAASKAGLIGLTRALAWELGKRGITANCLTPGLIDTELTAHVAGPRRDLAVAVTPTGRLGEPDDVAGVVRFLASDEARFINGAVVSVGGGFGMGS